MQQQFGRAYARVDRSIGQIEKRRRREIEAAIQATGVAVSDTHWKQAVDSWIQFIDSLKQAERKEREERFAARQNIPRVPRGGRRGRKRRRPEEMGSRSPTPESSPSPEPPSSRSSSRSSRQAQTSITAQNLPLILSSFSSTFIKGMEPMVKHMQENSRRDLQEFKQGIKDQNEALARLFEVQIERQFEEFRKTMLEDIRITVRGQLEEFRKTMVQEIQNTMQGQIEEMRDMMQSMEISKNSQKDI
ncbi:hypothetical protein DTO271G3_7743 [Paecilomyces variotii]|nr:hypothetical protein DTO271G3_7743 [Paecilomyces variotii]